MTNEEAIFRPTGDPLKLEQLRYMLENDGEIIGAAVIVSEDGVLSHAVLDERVDDGICASTGASGEWLKGKDYGKKWHAYAYQPAHIDREAWEPCIICNAQKMIINSGYCPNCGRPLTPEAWSELEKRLRG